jgi:hypothetical protein
MYTKEQKSKLIDIIKNIDVKQMTIDHNNETFQKWFRFGNYNALQIVTEIIKQLPEEDAAHDKSFIS